MLRPLAVTLWMFATLSAAAPAALQVEARSTPNLQEFALQKVLHDAAPIFGDYNPHSSHSKTETWMKSYADSTLIVHMNIPGTHDTATWNYSQATQDSLSHVTALNGLPEIDPDYFRCQNQSIVDMLSAGIRVFDLRYAFDATNTSLVFYHSQALQSETATLEDLLFGFYTWLDKHPSEALFLSLMYEGSTAVNAANSADVQTLLFEYLTSPSAKQYILQTKDELGTLGEARGKITLLRRFDLDQLPAAFEAAMPGLHFSPSLWTDNDPDITLVYNPAKNLTAYIEDFYETDAPVGTNASFNIQWKYNATTAHLTKAVTEFPDSLFWTWASSEYDTNIPPEFPRIMAVGNGTELTPEGGVNQKLIPFIEGLQGKRMGIVMFDFFGTPGNLIETFLGL